MATHNVHLGGWGAEGCRGGGQFHHPKKFGDVGRGGGTVLPSKRVWGCGVWGDAGVWGVRGCHCVQFKKCHS